MKKNLVRPALLSARLFADARSHPQLRPGGPGVMEIRHALQTLLDDADAPPDERHSNWLTRGRIAGALREALDPELRAPKAPIAEPAYSGTQNSVSFLLEQAAKADTTKMLEERAKEWDQLKPHVFQLAEAARRDAPRSLRDQLDFVRTSQPDDRGARPLDWQTEVTIAPNGATKVSSYVEVTGASFPLLAQLCDPSRWAEDSMFWFESTAFKNGERQRPPAPLALDQPPEPWEGQLLERVASTVAVFTALLDIDFQVEDDSCLVTYKLARPISGLTIDDGYAYVTKVGEDRYRTQLVKWVDFEEAPFGGPSVLDQMLPSYIGSWLRVQQDLWAAKAFLPD